MHRKDDNEAANPSTQHVNPKPKTRNSNRLFLSRTNSIMIHCVEGFLEGEDALATLQAFRDMGVLIEGPHHGQVIVHGVGLHGLKAPSKPLYMGNSGTSMRLLTGLLAGQAFDTELTGDESLSKRPMERVAGPLREMGARIDTGEGGRPPVRIHGGQTLKGIHYPLPMASAQVKSAVLLAGLYAEGDTSVTEPAPTRDHTERMLGGFGVPVRRDGATSTVTGGTPLAAGPLDVPADSPRRRSSWSAPPSPKAAS